VPSSTIFSCAWWLIWPAWDRSPGVSKTPLLRRLFRFATPDHCSAIWEMARPAGIAGKGIASMSEVPPKKGRAGNRAAEGVR
jgi:hypothetical protein